mgnify:CR=1 FL=1
MLLIYKQLVNRLVGFCGALDGCSVNMPFFVCRVILRCFKF